MQYNPRAPFQLEPSCILKLCSSQRISKQRISMKLCTPSSSSVQLQDRLFKDWFAPWRFALLGFIPVEPVKVKRSTVMPGTGKFVSEHRFGGRGGISRVITPSHLRKEFPFKAVLSCKIKTSSCTTSCYRLDSIFIR